jgi:peptidyl-prolyl cis-trans isomerase D
VKGGQTFVAAAAPAGLSAEDISVGPQTKAELTELAGAQIANAAYAASKGAVIGPVNTDLGWRVIKVDDILREGGKSLDAARAEISAKLVADKRKEAIESLVDTVQNAIDEGSSFSEAATAAKLTPIETPPLTSNGTSRTDPNYRLPADLAPALKGGFELAENDAPVVDPLPNNAGYVLVAPARIIAAAPAPLASIREKVTEDWIASQASQRAQQLAQNIANKAGTVTLTEAAKGSAQVRVEPVSARRIQLSQFQGNVPAPLAMLFSLGQGKARMVAGGQGEGFYVIKVNKVIPGNALNQPSIIGQTQQQMSDPLSQEYGQQFLNAMRGMIGVKRNEKAIQAAKTRISGTGS